MEIIISGYENLISIRGNESKEYVYELDALRSNIKDGDEFSCEERSHCLEVNEIAGTERWYQTLL